ncbi:MAG TPA: ribonuclease HI family protein, partial [Candidatus Saccharibacteria bacterium]|nr:ribonuclease HI family protein [Candidatus Saccharibacteria bacterium]
ALKIHLGVTVETMHIVDVMTFIDPDDRELQYVFIVFKASLSPTDRRIELSDEYDQYIWKKVSEIQHDELTQSTRQLLGLQATPFAPGREADVMIIDDAKNASYERLVGYCDGGSRGNPGPAASGYVLLDTSETVIAEGGTFLGITTNNIAEYQALYLALQKALELGATVVDMHLDSLLVVNQMNGIYRVKNNELLPIYNRIKELIVQFDRVTFTHVMREYNTLADGMVNKILDGEVIKQE